MSLLQNSCQDDEAVVPPPLFPAIWEGPRPRGLFIGGVLQKAQYEQQLAQKDTDFAKREDTLREREASLSKAKEAIDDQVAEKLKQERAKIAAEEAKKAKLALGNELDQKTQEVSELQSVLKQRNAKLAEAQKAQADLLKKQRELDDAIREQELTVEKRVQAGLEGVRDQARKEAEEGLKLKVMEPEFG
jgi:hypothetical protein